MAVITDAPPDDVDSASSPTTMRSGPPRWVAMTIVVLLVASAGVWWAKREPDPLRLGDRGHVMARVDERCDAIRIEVDGLDLEGGFGERMSNHIPFPRGWHHGDQVPGTLHLDRKMSPDSVRGTFTAADGTRVRVGGGLEGKLFSMGLCYSSG